MPSYHLEFEDGTGRAAVVPLSGPSLPALARRLAAEGLVLRRVVPRRAEPSLRAYWRAVSDAELTTALRQLAVTLRNGVPLPVALALMARESRNPTLQVILLDLERAVVEGDPLSSALGRYPRLFSPIYVRLLEAGEAGGSLPAVLHHLAEYAERASQASLRIRTALIYPQVVGLFTVILLGITFLFVVPKFVRLFEELGLKELPAVTVVLLWFSSVFLPSSLLAAPVLLGAVWLGWVRGERQDPFRIAALRARLPLVGALYHHFALLRLTRLLAALLRAGVPLLEAMRLAGQGSENPLLQAAMWDAIPHVADGETLATAFSHAGILPPTFCGQIAAAETSGDLPGALERLAAWYSERVDYLAARVGALLEPMFVLILAGLAGWVAMGVFLPVLAVIQNFSQ